MASDRQSRLPTYSQSIEILQLDGAMPYSDVAEYEDASVLFDMIANLDRLTWLGGSMQRLGQAGYGIDTGLTYLEAVNDMPKSDPPLPFWRPIDRNGKRWRYCATVNIGRTSRMGQVFEPHHATARAQPYALEPIWRLSLRRYQEWHANELKAVADMLENRAGVQEDGGIEPIPELHLQHIRPKSMKLCEPIRRIRALGTAVYIELDTQTSDISLYTTNALWYTAREYVASWTARHTISLEGHLSNLRLEHRTSPPSPLEHLPYGVLARVSVNLVLWEQTSDHHDFLPLAISLADQLREALQRDAAILGQLAAPSCQIVFGSHMILAEDRRIITAAEKKMLFETAECILREEVDKAKLLARAEYLRTLH